MEQTGRRYPYNLYFDIINEDADLEESTLLENLGCVLSRLSEKERCVMILRYSDSLTYSDIGKKCGLTKQRVHAIAANSRKKMRTFQNVYTLRHGRDAYDRRGVADSDGIEVLGLGTKAYSALFRCGYRTVADVKELLSSHSRKQIMSWPDKFNHLRSFGVKCYDDVAAKLGQCN